MASGDNWAYSFTSLDHECVGWFLRQGKRSGHGHGVLFWDGSIVPFCGSGSNCSAVCSCAEQDGGAWSQWKTQDERARQQEIAEVKTQGWTLPPAIMYEAIVTFFGKSSATACRYLEPQQCQVIIHFSLGILSCCLCFWIPRSCSQ